MRPNVGSIILMFVFLTFWNKIGTTITAAKKKSHNLWVFFLLFYAQQQNASRVLAIV